MQQAIEDLVEVADAYLADMVTAGIAVPPTKDQPRMNVDAGSIINAAARSVQDRVANAAA